jgi:hypothetical protein
VNRGLIALGLVLTLLGVGCKDNPTETTDFHFDYLPLILGSSITYSVDSIVYNDFDQSVVKYQFTLKETVAEVFNDASGRITYRIEQSKRESDTLNYRVSGSYAVLIDGLKAERTQNNLRTIPLIFPPAKGETWDGNATNTRSTEDYRFTTTHQPYSIGASSFDSTLHIVQIEDTTNFINKRFAEERYAKGVGLIELQTRHIETKLNGDSGLVWVQRYLSGN